MTVTTEPWSDSKILFLIEFQLILVFLCQLTWLRRLLWPHNIYQKADGSGLHYTHAHCLTKVSFIFYEKNDIHSIVQVFSK